MSSDVSVRPIQGVLSLAISGLYANGPRFYMPPATHGKPSCFSLEQRTIQAFPISTYDLVSPSLFMRLMRTEEWRPKLMKFSYTYPVCVSSLLLHCQVDEKRGSAQHLRYLAVPHSVCDHNGVKRRPRRL